MKKTWRPAPACEKNIPFLDNSLAGRKGAEFPPLEGTMENRN